MRNSWKQVTRRTVSLLLSLVLALTLVTPAAFATEAGTPDGQTVEHPQEQTGTETPETPETPEEPENPENQETPETPENPENPETPENPENPDDPEVPEEPEDPVKEQELPEDTLMVQAETTGVVWNGTTATAFAGGTGTKDDPYQISNGSELAYLAQQVNAGTAYAGSYFKLTADIRLNSEDVPTSGNTWTPIGNDSSFKFAGTFDGNGHMVSGLYIEKTVTIASPFKAYMGLFGNNTGTIRNLIVKGSVSVVNTKTALTRVAGIVGENNNSKEAGTVQNCGFHGTVTAKKTNKGDESDSTSSNGGVVGSGNALNCWYYRTDDTASKLGVCGGTATNCCHNVSGSTKGQCAADLNTEDVVNGAKGLNIDNDAAGKKWAVDPKEGALYPKLIDPPKTITMQPVFPDCKAVVTAGETTLNADNEYTYTLGEAEESVTITVSGDDTIYYADRESETSYTAEGNLTAIGADTTFNKNDLPNTYYYGTLADFEALAAWNSILSPDGKSATVTTVDQLKILTRMVNRGKDSMAGKTITLGANIDLKDTDWTPIGTTDNRFKGTFTAKWENWEDWTTNFYTISNLPNDLFGVVDGGTLQYVTINNGTGRLVNTLTSGTVENCMSTAQVTDEEGGGLVGTSTGTVQNSYYYNEDSAKPVAAGTGKLTKCFYLADTSTWGQTGDKGARTEEEFKAGRVTYELGTEWKCGANDKMPHLDGEYSANEVSLRKGACPEGSTAVVTLTSDGVLSAADGTQYFYGKVSETVSGTISDLSQGDTVVFEPAASYNDNCDFTLRVQSSRSVRYTYTLLKANIKWYTDNQSTKTYAFTSPDELVGLALLTNGKIHAAESFSGWTLTLANDIDLRDITWTPIGDTNINRFAGVFDGCGKTIKGLSVKSVNLQYAGLFGNMTGTVKNLQVDGSMHVERSEAGMFYVGGIVGSSTGTVQNCLSKVDVTAENKGTGNTSVGGVVGSNSGTVTSCQNEGNVEGTGGNSVGSNVGGIVGSNGGSSAVANCANFGAVKGSGTAGGIAGSGSVANCYNLGDVTGGAKAYGISYGTVNNSYYVCKLNGTEKMAYVNNAPEAEVKYNGADKTYTVGDDAALLVDTLNKNRDGNTPWFVNQDEGVYLPIHVLKWTGDQDDRFTGKIITITYYPNGGVNKDGVDDPISVPVTLTPDIITGGFNAKSYTILAADSETLGFKHENGVFAVWKDKSNTEYAAGTTIQVSENITLYAQWDAIWAGTGTESDPYQISDAEKLTALQTQVNDKGFSYMGKYFALPANGTITLTGEWTPIGNDTATFSGNIEGNNATINGLSVTQNYSAGLFKGLSPRGTTTYIRNLTISGTATSAYGHAGGLTASVDDGNITLSNITTNVAVSAPRGSAGGLIGYAGAPVGGARDPYIKVVSCTNEGTITGTTAGGVAGATDIANNARSQFALQNCRNNGSVTGTVRAGGMLGGSAGSKAVGCENSGVIVATGERAQAGGISATTLQLAERCVNTGTVSGTFAGGIAYELPVSGKATRCRNEGSVTGTNLAAGIVVYGTSREGYGAGVSFSCNFGVITAPKAYGIASGGIVKNSFTYNGGKHVAISGSKDNVTNSYYLASSDSEFSSAVGGTPATLDDFASGKVAWGVDGGTDAHKNYWTQGSDGYPIPIVDGKTSTSYYRAQATCGTGGTVTIKRGDGRTGDSDNAVYGPVGTTVTVTATPKDSSFALKSLTLDLMSTGSTSDLRTGGSFTLGEANAKVEATFASAGSGGGSGSGSGSGSGTGAGDENDEGLQDGLNMDVEYNVKGLVLSAYTEWGANGGGKTFSQWLKDSPNVLRALIANSLDNMAAAAAAKKTDEASALAQTLLASLNEHSGVTGKDSDAIGKALQRFMTSGTEATFSTWLTTGSGMASGTVESILTQYTDSLLALADRLYTKWESSGTSMTFPVWLDAQQVSMANLSKTAEEPDTDTTNDPQTTEAPEDVPDGQESEGQASGNSIWEIIGTAVRENPLIVWFIVAVIAAIVIVGAVRRYHKVKRDERDDNSAE